VLERVDGLGAGRLEEQLGDVGAALGQRPDPVGEIATVGVGLPASATWRFATVRLEAGMRALYSADGALCGARLP